MPRCLTCERTIEAENARCDVCARQDSVPAPGPGEQVVGESASPEVQAPGPPADDPSGPAVAVSPPSPPHRSPGWTRWHVAAGLSAAALTAAVTIALVAGGDPADRSAAPALDHASFGPAAAREAPSPAPPTVKWMDATKSRWVSNHKRSIAFELPAENTASSWLTRVRPVLVVRCLANTTDVFVFTQVPPAIEPGDDTRTVRLQFDGEDEYTTRWSGSADHDALFAPEPIAFARRLARAETMRFGFTPHNGPPATIVFDVRGVDARVDAVARSCRWK